MPMRPHYFKPMQIHDKDGKIQDADWCVYIDQPADKATREDFCQRQASHPFHVSIKPEGKS